MLVSVLRAMPASSAGNARMITRHTANTSSTHTVPSGPILVLSPRVATLPTLGHMSTGEHA